MSKRCKFCGERDGHVWIGGDPCYYDCEPSRYMGAYRVWRLLCAAITFRERFRDRLQPK